MSEERDPLALRTATTRRKTWWPGWIWAIPIAAIGIVVWLMLRALSSRGVEVTLVLEDAVGMSDNNTKVLYRGLEVGTVSDLALAPDGRHVIAHLDIDRDMRPYIHSGTRFYVEGAHPSFSDPASLKAVISGPTIELVPGTGADTGAGAGAGTGAGSRAGAGSRGSAGPGAGAGEQRPVRRFIAIEGKPPERLSVAVPYVVTFSGAIGGIEAGSPVMLGGFPVGEVASTELATDAQAGRINTRALLRLDPTRFHIEGAAPRGEDWASVMNSALAQRLDDSIRHLDRTLAELDRTVRSAGPQVAPTLGDVRRTVASLRRTAVNIDATAAAAQAMMSGRAAVPGGSVQQALQELTDAARSIRALADYLDQHPEALIRGR